MLARKHYDSSVQPFLAKIEDFAKRAGVRDIKDYVGQGGWKRRSSGDLVDQSSFINFEQTTPNLVATIINPTQFKL